MNTLARLDPEKNVDLVRFAEATAGRALALDEATGYQPVAGGGAASLRVLKLWNLCLLLALLCYLADLIYRRWPTRELS